MSDWPQQKYHCRNHWTTYIFTIGIKFQSIFTGMYSSQSQEWSQVLPSPLRTTGNAALTRKYGFEVTEGTWMAPPTIQLHGRPSWTSGSPLRTTGSPYSEIWVWGDGRYLNGTRTNNPVTHLSKLNLRCYQYSLAILPHIYYCFIFWQHSECLEPVQWISNVPKDRLGRPGCLIAGCELRIEMAP